MENINPVNLKPVPMQTDETAARNILTYYDYYKRLRLIALNMFEWELPETMNVHFLEYCLYWYGQAAFVNDKNLGFINTNCTPSETLNIYHEPIQYHCYSIGYDENFPLDSMAYVRNNFESIPTDETIRLFAARLYEAERTIEVNIRAQKTPVVVVCDQNNRLSMVNVYKDVDGNNPVIYADKKLNLDDITVFRTDAPFVADKVNAYKQVVWSEALTFLGINNTPHEKRERLVTDEVNSNNQMIENCAEVMLACRREAAEKFNKLYGTNISVKLRTPIISEKEGGENDGEENPGGTAE